MPRNMRYEPLYDVVEMVKPGVIVEIGTHNGHRAIRMIDRALQYRKASEIRYIGFDLFEDMNADMLVEQFKAKPKGRAKFQTAQRRIGERGIEFELHKGDSRQTAHVHAPKRIDLAFIDGGHEIATIRSDYYAVKHAKHIVFDDVYLNEKIAREFGALNVAREIRDLGGIGSRPRKKITLFAHYDHSELGETCMALVSIPS